MLLNRYALAFKTSTRPRLVSAPFLLSVLRKIISSQFTGLSVLEKINNISSLVKLVNN